ncbi:hypothetical protein [Paractinoplanes rishiriensis]|uniref:Uncharacterized protein n=1 Tax=Paractinoplanes rishiriensis TaxID=1050105 RepID=A0A919K1R9_9ACTN|nr:hypothetical protein [Actinoplanes rishiriensis]GIE97637.1 hypothetical protein Ari01nite_51020 [Actinoplanes rishiriensis]
MSLFDAAVYRLRARVVSFDDDLERWVERTSDQGDLPQHRTQVLRLRDYLGGMLDAVVQGTPVDPKTAPPFAGTVDAIPDLRRGVGSVHLVWDFFRDKLTQRDTDDFADHLGAADGLAWACYQPFLRAASAPDAHAVGADEVREPPLVFYSTDRTPFAQARTKTLHPPGLDAKDLEVFAAALQRLPVPVIGLPWDLARRMPETCLVGHETGHVIAEDLHLAEEARAALREAGLSHVWLSWCDEIFADVIGVLATGSAYLEGLTVELAGARDEVRTAPVDERKPGRYPTRMLRVALCEEFLGRVEVASEKAWTGTYGRIAGPYANDVPIVAAALMDRSWAALGGRKLAEVLPWNAEREQNAQTVGRQELDGRPVPVPFDTRVWVAAAMHAYREDPGRYASRELDRKLAAAIVARREPAKRSSAATREVLFERERTLESVVLPTQLREADRRAGAALARELGLT